MLNYRFLIKTSIKLLTLMLLNSNKMNILVLCCQNLIGALSSKPHIFYRLLINQLKHPLIE